MKKTLLILILSFSIFINKVYALDDNEMINPQWLKYIELSEEERKNYGEVPEKYIYKYVSKNKFNNYSNKYKSITDVTAGEILPNYFNLNNYNGKRYVNPSSKDQSNLGLCWAFATFGTLESNILYKGVTGITDEISKCDMNSNPNSKSCAYKIDNDINEKYINKESSINATFSERQLDYSRSSSDNFYENYNPYQWEYYTELGTGANFSDAVNSFAYGVSPRRALGVWEKYDTSKEKKSLSDVYDVNNLYGLKETITMPITPVNVDDRNNWIVDVKNQIMENGAGYVSTAGPSAIYAGSCFYVDKKYSQNGEKIYLVNEPYGTKCDALDSGNHAYQIVGWDDDYTFEYCKVGYLAKDNYTKSSCEDAGYTWTEGKGAWILKNSWGSSEQTVYLSYQSYTVPYFVKEVSTVDYDNSYSEKNTYVMKNDNDTVKQYIRKIYKASEDEILTSINFINGGTNSNYEIYVSNDGEDFKKISSFTKEYPGLTTVDTNFTLNNKFFFIKIVTNNKISNINAFTKDKCSLDNTCSKDISIDSEISFDTDLINNKKEYKIYTKTRNISSGSKLTYRIFDSSNNDLTDKFNIKENYVVNNSVTSSIESKISLDVGKYYLKISYGDYEYVKEFAVSIRFNYKDNILLEDKTATPTIYAYDIKQLSNIKWSSSNLDIAEVDENGKLTLLSSGPVSITLEADSPYGKVTYKQEIIIYEKVTNIEEFFNIFSSTNDNYNKSYYLTNDLDFKDVDFSKYSTKKFFGIFNGGLHTLKNINKVDKNDGGLFIQVNGATIMNLKIVDSTFKGLRYTGSVVGNAQSSVIKNIYSNATINGSYAAGGIVGYLDTSELESCFSNGAVNANSTAQNTFAGGIVGYSKSSNIVNTVNFSKIVSETSYNNSSGSISYASGIVGFDTLDSVGVTENNHIVYKDTNSSTIKYSYNIGNIIAENSSTNGFGKTIKNGLIQFTSDKISNSYYLEDDSYTSNYDNQSKTLEELKNKDTFVDWDFIHVWNINNDSTPNLRVFSKKIEDIELNVDTNTLNTNSEYIYSYTFTPTDTSGDVNITSSDTNIIEIKDNKLITKDKTGSVKININVDNIKKEYTFEVVNILDYSYTKEYTNKDIDINFNINYYLTKLNNEYLKLIYGINNELKTIIFDKEKNIINDTIKIDKNGLIKLELYKCNDESCEIITSKEENIIYIDKDKPIIEYNLNTNDKSLIINIYDNTTGLKDNNVYEYAISNSNKTKPNSLTKYKINEKITNLPINYNNKYLWIKNVYDLANNGICDEEYCVYDLKINRVKYKVKYYDEDKQTILKEEEYLEDDILNATYIPTKETEEYNYKFIKWDGYENNMKVTKDINLYAVYEKVRKELISDVYIIENGYIKNIKLNNIKEVYNIDKFKSNIKGLEDYEYYENNKKIEEPKYIKTGQVIKNINKEYKLVLTGDVTKDGYVKMNDIMKIANHIVNGNVLKEETYYAADINNDGKIKMNDLMKIADVIVNGGSL